MRCTLLVLILLWTAPVSAQVDGCIYHHHSQEIVKGTPIFLEMWQSGCTEMTFVLYAGRLWFSSSPCYDHNLGMWESGNAWFYQDGFSDWKKSNFRLDFRGFWIARDEAGGNGSLVSSATLWCGEPNKPVRFPGPIVKKKSERSEEQKRPHTTVQFYPYMDLFTVGIVIMTSIVIVFIFVVSWREAIDLPSLKAQIEDLHIKKVESGNWSGEWRRRDLDSLPDSSVDTTKILREWRVKSSKQTYNLIARKAHLAAKHFGEDEKEVSEMLINENEEDIKRWELITGEERPPWGIRRIDRKKKRT